MFSFQKIDVRKKISKAIFLAIFFFSACSSISSPNLTKTSTMTLPPTVAHIPSLFSQPSNLPVSTPAPTNIAPMLLLTKMQTSITSANTPTSIPWMDRPVIPTISDNAIRIYQHGLELGNNPHAFSKIGDGEIATSWFMIDFDLGPQFYNLGKYTSLQENIEYFAGSFGRYSQAARSGFNTSRILDPALADQQVCHLGETPLDCELREHRPSLAFISLGTNQVWEPTVFSRELRIIVETLINHGVLPILSTKGDNLEGDQRINMIISEVASEYDVPLWNFWSSIQILPNQGLQDDREHLSWGKNNFSEENLCLYAWPVRNLTALQVLDAVRRANIK